ncbi:O-fucosyltransferase 8 isoform X2 [Tripterygium wilfordii]|uniref:O-fucosyltransferase 8 isoform X2 n=1 Tax=Tripterygium wilfordii TaxID=458696 RepID=UPI0018F813D8|nr:O-fucosyltransferase 8 isoform X2 [Tripterygium wilfordii]
MGKQGSRRSPRPESRIADLSVGMKDYKLRTSDNSVGGDPCIGRRNSGGDINWNSKVTLADTFKSDYGKPGPFKGVHVGKKHMWFQKHMRSIVFMFSFMGFLFLLDSFMVSIFASVNIHNSSNSNHSSVLKKESAAHINETEAPVQMYSRLLNLASASLAESLSKRNQFSGKNQIAWHLYGNPVHIQKKILAEVMAICWLVQMAVSINNELLSYYLQICNAVAVASLLNATLVLPRFLYSNVWKDPSQFGDIYQEDYFMNTLKDEVSIVKELPSHLKSLDIEAIGSLITDADIMKEAKPFDYSRKVLPLLLRNGVVHFLGFGNRLGFDPLPLNIQKLRCRCNFHALKFVPKIQQVGSLLIGRIRKYEGTRSLVDKQLLGNFMPDIPLKNHNATVGPSRYLALHMRFEVDMVAYSLCDFGGGETERKELQAYREVHFPLLLERLKISKPISPVKLRKLGRCPLTPEEAALVLAGLSLRRGTYIYMAGSQIYGGESKMHPFTSLYPNVVTKETLLTPSELAPFKNFSSQLAALDFIACASADVFAMTDSGSQLASLVSGFRTYYGDGHAPVLRPNKKRLAAILSESSTIGWESFEGRVRKMIEEGQRVRVRGFGRSIYRLPRCPECMCKS